MYYLQVKKYLEVNKKMENQPTEVNMVEICGNFKKETRSYEDYPIII